MTNPIKYIIFSFILASALIASEISPSTVGHFPFIKTAYQTLYLQKGENLYASSIFSNATWETDIKNVLKSNTEKESLAMYTFPYEEGEGKLWAKANGKKYTLAIDYGYDIEFYLLGISEYRDTNFESRAYVKESVETLFETFKKENVAAQKIHFLTGKLAKYVYAKSFINNMKEGEKKVLVLYLNAKVIQIKNNFYMALSDSYILQGKEVNTNRLIHINEIANAINRNKPAGLILFLDGFRVPNDVYIKNEKSFVKTSFAASNVIEHFTKSLDQTIPRIVFNGKQTNNNDLANNIEIFLSKRKAIDERGYDGRVSIFELKNNMVDMLYENKLKDLQSLSITHYKWSPSKIAFTNVYEMVYEEFKTNKEYERFTRNFVVYRKKFTKGKMKNAVGKKVKTKKILIPGFWH